MKHSKEKTISGSFYTTKTNWLTKQVIAFFEQFNPKVVTDPFAGDGHLLDLINEKFGCATMGYDLYKHNWQQNDSLVEIPDSQFIVTNPPWLSKTSASKKKIMNNVMHYFDINKDCTNLYQIAIKLMIMKKIPFICLVPESILTMEWNWKHKLTKIISLFDSPFDDTNALTCVVCYDPEKESDDVEVYSDDNFIGYLKQIESVVLKPNKSIDIKFNVADGPIGVRCLDLKSEDKRAKFFTKENFTQKSYSNLKNLRYATHIAIDLNGINVDDFVNYCNEELENYRKTPAEIFNCSFMENTNYGTRRRRISFEVIRAILEKVFHKFKCLQND